MEDEEIRQRLITAKEKYGSLRKLSPGLGISFTRLSRYLLKQRSPSIENRKKLEKFLENVPPSKEPYKRRFRIKIDFPLLSRDLAELVGILFGDGCVGATGDLSVCFDELKERYFISERVIPLIFEIVKPTTGHFNQSGRICFQKSSFVNWLRSTGFPTGSRPINDAKIPQWCFSKEEYLASFVRGLFDTDGNFTFVGNSTQIAIGDFSSKYTKFPWQVCEALQTLGIKSTLYVNKRGRYRIFIVGKRDLLLFFSIVGSSNPKHISRFLLWRISNKQVRIDAQPIENVIFNVELLTGIHLGTIPLPFYWNSSNSVFYKWIYPDSQFLSAHIMRDFIDWKAVTKSLLNDYAPSYLSSILTVLPRSIRRWRQGARNISVINCQIFLNTIFKMNKQELIWGNYNYGKIDDQNYD